jgi:hypothetical protein
MAVLTPGDKVRVRYENSFIKEFGEAHPTDYNVPYGFNHEMMELCGKIVTIANTATRSEGEPPLYTLEECGYNWSNQMFELEEFKFWKSKGICLSDIDRHAYAKENE